MLVVLALFFLFYVIILQKDIELRELIDQNQSALQQYAELVAKTIDTGPVVIRYLSEKGIQLPMLKSPSESIKYASTTSLVSSPGEGSLSTRSSETQSFRSSSSHLVSPSVVTLDSTQLGKSTTCFALPHLCTTT